MDGAWFISKCRNLHSSDMVGVKESKHNASQIDTQLSFKTIGHRETRLGTSSEEFTVAVEQSRFMERRRDFFFQIYYVSNMNYSMFSR